MKRILAIFLTLLMVLSLLSGCNFAQNRNPVSTSDDSQSSEESSAGDESQDGYPSESTPPETTGVSEKDEEPLFQYNPYVISTDARAFISDHEYDLYCEMIDSIFAHDGVISGFSSREEYDKLQLVLLSEFVPVRNLIQTYLQSDEPFLYENGTATFQFVGDQETCARNYARFEAIMNEALSLIKKNDTDWKRIAKLYLYVTEHMSYGSPYESYGVSADLYNCILYKLGQCGAYATYLNMLANQIGFDTIDGISLGKNGFTGADHAWSMIRVEGQWYHFDACWQAPLSTYENMDYFAISTQERYDSLAHNSFWGGVGEVEMFSQQYYTLERSELPSCTNGMSANDRERLYRAVIDEYRQCLYEMPEDTIEPYIDSEIAVVQEALDSSHKIGIWFEIIPGTMNSALKDLILTYSPQDLQEYPTLETEEGSDRCSITPVILQQIDQSDLKFVLYSILTEGIVVKPSVRLVIF